MEQNDIQEFRNAMFLPDGRIDCEIDHPEYSWVPTTLSRDESPDFFDHVLGTGEVAAYSPPPHVEQRGAALVQINEVHAGFLRRLTGNATVEERDTWKTKEEAARALIAGAASEGQTAMIHFEAEGGGIDPMVLAQTVVAKAEAFQGLIGMAAGLKAKAKAAIMQATDEAVPIDQVGPALETLFAQLSTEADAAVAQWHEQTHA